MVAIFVLLTFITFIVIDHIVLKLQNKKHPAFIDNTPKAVFNKGSIFSPENVFVSRGHTWAELLKDGTVKIGIDDIIVKALGKFKLNFISGEGTVVKQGDAVINGTFNGVNFKFRTPVDGKIKKINNDLTGKFIDDPFSQWGIIVEPDNFEKNKKSLKTGEELSKWLKDEFSRLKDFLGHHPVKPELAGITMHDGGNIIEGALVNVSSEGLKSFETEFLTF